MLDFIYNLFGNTADTIITGLGDAFSHVWNWVLQLVSGMLPQRDPSNFLIRESLDTVLEVGYQFSFVIPWQTLFMAVAFIFSWHLTIFVVRFSKWVIERIH